MNNRERTAVEYCQDKGRELERADAENILEYIGSDDRIEKRNGVIYWDWVGGVNYYGEIIASVESYKNGQFRVEKNGISVGWFRNDELYETLMGVI